VIRLVTACELVVRMREYSRHDSAGGTAEYRATARLDPFDPATLHEYALPAGAQVELHRHDFDEYWWFIIGEPVITLCTQATGPRQYQLQAGDLVACVRGVAHTLHADHLLVYCQCSSVRQPGAREGHLPGA